MRDPKLTYFPNIKAFYAARGGDRSGELDFGVWWRGPFRETYRISAVKDTGDVYAARMIDGEITLLGTLEPGYDHAESALKGWVEEIHKPDSLAWAVWRIAEAERE